MKDLIKNLRTQNNLTLKAFADSIGVSSTAVSNYEKGTKKPGEKTLEKIAEKYGVTVAELKGEVKEVKDTAKMVKTAVELAAPVIKEEAVEKAEEVKENVKGVKAAADFTAALAAVDKADDLKDAEKKIDDLFEDKITVDDLKEEATKKSTSEKETVKVTEPKKEELLPADRWILSRLNTVVREVTENMERYELGIAVQKIHDFIWDEFCDWYIELAKFRFANKEGKDVSANAALYTLRTVLTEALKLLHPFMPFITEEIYCTLLPEEKTIMIAAWPTYSEDMNYPAEEQQLENFKAIVRGIRNVRTEMNVPAGTRTDLYIVGSDKKATEEISALLASLGGAERMLFAKEVFVKSDREGIAEDAVSVVTGNATAYIPLDELVDKEKEIARLTAESEKMDKEIKRASGMLNNPNFVSKAPAAKVQAEKEKLAKYEEMKKRILEQLAKYMN